MNAMADELGLDWGYAEGSEDWVKCGTSCDYCDDLDEAKTASSHMAKLMDDYGISNTLAKKIKPIISDIVKMYKNDDVEGALKYDSKTFKGTLLSVAKRVPDDMEDALSGYRYEIRFKDGRPLGRTIAEAMYIPSQKLVRVVYDVGLAVELGMAMFKSYKSRIIRDFERYELSLKHETTHAVRDAVTGHIRKYTKTLKEMEVREQYRDRGHLDLEFEVDATINSFAVLKRKVGARKWELMTFLDLEERIPGLRIPVKGDPAWRVWVKRMHREGLLSKAMKEKISGKRGSIADAVVRTAFGQ